MWYRTSDGRLINLAALVEIKTDLRCEGTKFCVIGIAPNLRVMLEKYDTECEAKSKLNEIWTLAISPLAALHPTG